MRPALAFLLTPVLSPLTVWVIALVRLGSRGHTQLDWAAAGHSLFFIALVGTPIAYAVAFVLGVPAYLLLRQRGWLSIPTISAVGAAIGAILVAIFVAMLESWHWASIGWGAGLGFVPALAFAVMIRQSTNQITTAAT